MVKCWMSLKRVKDLTRGVALGIFLTVASRFVRVSDVYEHSTQLSESVTHHPQPVSTREGLYVGLISASQYLSTRTRAVLDTWGRDVDKLEVFIGTGSKQDNNIPVIVLPGKLYVTE